MRLLCTVALTLSFGAFVVADDQKDRADRLKSLQKKYDADFGELLKRFEKAATPVEKRAVKTEAKELATLTAEKVVKLAGEAPKDAVAFDAVVFVLTRLQPFGVGDADVDKAIAIVTEHHLNNPKVQGLVLAMSQYGPAGQKFLKAAAEKSTDKKVKGIALYYLGTALAEAADDADDSKQAEELTARAIKSIEEAIQLAPTVELEDGLLAVVAKAELAVLKTLGVGKPAPDVEGVNLDGKKVKLSSFKGKVVLLDIWATWCGPCRAMIPHERELVKKLKDKPFVLLSVSADQEKQALTKFLDKEPMPWTHWWDGGDQKVLKTFRVKAFPTMYLIDANGVVRKKWVGSPGNAVLDKSVEELVNAAEKK